MIFKTANAYRDILTIQSPMLYSGMACIEWNLHTQLSPVEIIF